MSLVGASSPRALVAPEGRIVATVMGREWRRSGKSLLAWLVPGVVYGVLVASIQPQMAQQGSMFEAKLQMMPQELLVAFGLDSANLGDPVSYLAANFALLSLLGAVFAAMLGAGLLSREESEGTSELLWSLPVPRRTVVLAKVAMALLLILGWELGVMAAVVATFAAVGVATATALIGAVFLGAYLIHAAVFALALLVTTRTRRPRGATSVGLGLAFACYGIGIAAALAPKLEPLRWLSPFRYAEANTIAQAGGLPGSAGWLVLVTVAAVAVAVALFEHKDLPG